MIRIVKMVFREDEIPNFESIFEASKEKIRNQEGCQHLALLQDKKDANIFFTYSIWEDPIYLEKYRNSDLFKSVWTATKALFKDKPEAWSVEQNIVLP